MPTFNILEAKTQLSRLVEAVETGAETEIIIARNGRPVARLVSVAAPKKSQRIGVAAGRFVIPDDIDRDNDLIREMFEGSDAHVEK